MKIYDVIQIYVGINFDPYNEYNNINSLNESIKLKESPITYLFSDLCFKSLLIILKSSISKKNVKLGTPKLNKEEFWKYKLESSASSVYRNYKYPNSYQKSLVEISRYCRENNIKLVFFIPPTHVDLQQKVNEFQLESEEDKFRTDLSNLGTTYDFNYSNIITQNYDNFSDPFHFNASIGELIIKEIVTNNTDYSHLL